MHGGSFEETKNMARNYLRLGKREIPVTNEQVRQFNQHRLNPRKIEELKATIFAEAGVRPELVEKFEQVPAVSS